MQRPCADVNSPYKRKCWINSGGPLVTSLLWGPIPPQSITTPIGLRRNSLFHFRENRLNISIFKKIFVEITVLFLFFAKVIQNSANVRSFFKFCTVPACHIICRSSHLLGSSHLSVMLPVCCPVTLMSDRLFTTFCCSACLLFQLSFFILLLLPTRTSDGQSTCRICYRYLLWWAWLSVGSVCLEYSLYTVFSAPRFVWYTSTAFSSLSKLKIKINSGTTATAER